MRINKHTTIGYIYKGKYNSIKCMYSHNYMDLIPLYVSDTIKGIRVIKFIDSSIIIIVGNRLYHRCNGKVPDILIMHSIITSCLDDQSKADLYCARWYGLGPTILVLENIKNSDDRIKILKQNIYKYGYDAIPNIEDMLDNIKSVEVI